jgi:hypothetical protein
VGAEGPAIVTRLARRLLRGVVYALLVANLATLWIVRDGYVNGWEFFGATYGVLALNAGSFAQGVPTILQSVLQQKGRVVFTGGESLIYGLVPGLLDNLMPWLL